MIPDEDIAPRWRLAGAGGVGSILTQITARLTGLRVIATASRPETIEWVKAMGAHHVIDHRKPLNEGLAAIGIPQVRYIVGLTASDRHQRRLSNRSHRREPWL